MDNDLIDSTQRTLDPKQDRSSCFDLENNHQISVGKLRARPTSPPPPPPDQAPTVSATASPSQSILSSTYSGYQRKKSQSVKLTRLDQDHPNEKKAVRFADDFGLELSQIKMIKSDDILSVPMGNLNLKDERIKILTSVQAEFENPIHAVSFSDRLSRSNIVLEQANVIDNRMYGTIKLISFGLHKRVKVRLTANNWTTFRDYEATYMINSHDGNHDRFSFTIELDPVWIYHGNQIQFCLCYQNYAGLEYWDNNHHQNYRFNCFSRTIPDFTV